MADVRSLLRNERVSRRVNHPHANYSDSGKLSCAVCNIPIKTESLWENHIKSPQHSARLEHLRANPPPAPATSQARKRKAGETDDQERKRVKAVPGSFVPEGFFDANEEGADEEVGERKDADTAPAPSIPDARVAELQPVASAPPPAPDVNEDEWAAFEREMATTQTTSLPIISASATISAAPVTAEELAAQAREEMSAQRTAREAELEADTEDATVALLQEFDEMEELDERVRRLREKREAIRLSKQQDTLPDAPAPTLDALQQDKTLHNDDEEDEDDEDDEFDDWTFGAR
jgi:zinc finger protein 830